MSLCSTFANISYQRFKGKKKLFALILLCDSESDFKKPYPNKLPHPHVKNTSDTNTLHV